jgi:hypothetical protein
VAEESEIAGWWDNTETVSDVQPQWGTRATHEGMSFLIDRKVFSSINPEIFPLFWFFATS